MRGEEVLAVCSKTCETIRDGRYVSFSDIPVPVV